MLDVDMLFFKQSRRIPKSVKANRDLLVYCLWKSGILTNTKIGELFGVSYSSISHIVTSVQSVLERNKEYREKFMKTYSLFCSRCDPRDPRCDHGDDPGDFISEM